MKKLLIALIALVASATVTARVYETIIMRNGNSYEGYLRMQKTNGDIAIWADTTVAYIPSSKIERIERQPQKYEYTATGKKIAVGKKNLSDIYLSVIDTVEVVAEEVAVLDSVAALDDTVADSVLRYEAVEEAKVEPSFFRDEVIKGVEILEEGSVVKYRDTVPHELNSRMSEISVITRELRNPKQINGLNDVIVTKNGNNRYVGQIVSTEPGRLIRINSDGRVYSVAVSDIARQLREPVDIDESIINQAPLIETIYLKNNEVLRDVVIIEQDFVNSTFKYVDNKNLTNQRKLKDIREIRKDVNRYYAPRMEFKFEKDSVYLNREVISFIACKRDKNELKVKIPAGAIHSFAADRGVITIESENNDENKRLQLVPVNVIGSEIKIDLTGLVDSAIPVSVQEVNKNGILSRSFTVRSGVYALVNTNKNMISIFRVR